MVTVDHHIASFRTGDFQPIVHALSLSLDRFRHDRRDNLTSGRLRFYDTTLFCSTYRRAQLTDNDHILVDGVLVQ